MAVDAPVAAKAKSPAKQRAGSSFEFYAWIFMRVSGILLVLLVLGHLWIMHIIDGGVSRVDFAFVAGRWANPFWQVYDWMLLMLATVHGANGMRTITEDYVRKDSTRMYAKFGLYFMAFLMLVLGTLVIVAFDPCIDPDSTLSVCL